MNEFSCSDCGCLHFSVTIHENNGVVIQCIVCGEVYNVTTTIGS